MINTYKESICSKKKPSKKIHTLVEKKKNNKITDKYWMWYVKPIDDVDYINNIDYINWLNNKLFKQ